MDFKRLSALMVAFIAAILVVLAGKSCADDAIRQSERSKAADRDKGKVATVAPDTRQDPGIPQETAPSASEDEMLYEVVTNMLGDVVETIPITTAEDFEEAETTTVTKSILEAYEDLHTVPNEENAVTETTTKYIEPATNIVIKIG